MNIFLNLSNYNLQDLLYYLFYNKKSEKFIKELKTLIIKININIRLSYMDDLLFKPIRFEFKFKSLLKLSFIFSLFDPASKPKSSLLSEIDSKYFLVCFSVSLDSIQSFSIKNFRLAIKDGISNPFLKKSNCNNSKNKILLE